MNFFYYESKFKIYIFFFFFGGGDGGKRDGMWTVVSDFFIKNPNLEKKTFFGGLGLRLGARVSGFFLL